MDGCVPRFIREFTDRIAGLPAAEVNPHLARKAQEPASSRIYSDGARTWPTPGRLNQSLLWARGGVALGLHLPASVGAAMKCPGCRFSSSEPGPKNSAGVFLAETGRGRHSRPFRRGDPSRPLFQPCIACPRRPSHDRWAGLRFETSSLPPYAPWHNMIGDPWIIRSRSASADPAGGGLGRAPSRRCACRCLIACGVSDDVAGA